MPIFILVLSFLFQFYYALITPWWVRTHDVERPSETGHLGYILYVANNRTFPPPLEGSEYHQPQLYYILAAFWHRLFTFVTPGENFKHLQLLSVLFFSLFLIVAAQILKRMIKSRTYYYLAFFILAFWPSGIIDSARIGNDVLSYLLLALALLFAIRYWQENQSQDLLLFSFATFLSLMTKSTALVLLPIFALMIAKNLAQSRLTKTILLPGGIILFGIALSLLPKYLLSRGSELYWLVPPSTNTITWTDTLVGNEIGNYTYFDLKTFLTVPYSDAFFDYAGRQWFWNQFIKTALMSEHPFWDYESPTLNAVAGLISAVGLFIAFSIGLRVLFVSSQELRRNLLIYASLFFGVAAVIYFRAKFPCVCNVNFRYIFPLLPFFIFVLIEFLQSPWLKTRPVLFGLSHLLILSLPILSILFFSQLILLS